MSYVKRKIDLTFTLAPNLAADGYVLDPGKPSQPFFAGSNGANQVKVTGRRVICDVMETGQRMGTTASVRVFGLSLDIMNKLSTWGKQTTQISRNSVRIETGDDVSGMSTIFVGGITDAMIDFSAQPEVALQVSAFTAAEAALTAAKSSSYNALVDVSTVMKDLASRSNMLFHNGGVTSRLSYPYYHGTYIDQIDACAREAGIEYDISQNTLSIWPKGQAKDSKILLISPQTGMKGYPTFFPLGINVEVEHTANLGFGSLIEVQSSIQPACGKWITYRMQHNVASEIPDGPWFTSVQCAKPGTVPVAT